MIFINNTIILAAIYSFIIVWIDRNRREEETYTYTSKNFLYYILDMMIHTFEIYSRILKCEAS